jgi:hypothetical protein
LEVVTVLARLCKKNHDKAKLRLLEILTREGLCTASRLAKLMHERTNRIRNYLRVLCAEGKVTHICLYSKRKQYNVGFWTVVLADNATVKVKIPILTVYG